MEQDPESPENAGENATMHLLPELQRIVRDFARPVFRRCGRQLRVAETKSNSGGHQGFACTKIGADERRSRDSQQANGAAYGRVPLDVGRAPLTDGCGDAWHLHRGCKS